MRIFIIILVVCSALHGASPSKTKSKIPFVESSETFKSLLIKRLPEHTRRIENIFSDSRFCLDTLILFIKAGKRKINFDSLLFCEESIRRGSAFLKKNNHLDSIQALFNIRKSRIVGVYRVETDLGTFLGEHNAVCAYSTLYWISKTPQGRLSQVRQFASLLNYCFARTIDPYNVQVSWAGAVGHCQFMPSNLSLAVDGDGDRIPDILHSETDALYSIGNFLRCNGWNPQKEVRSLRRYNNSQKYARWVIDYADAIEKYLEKNPHL